MMELGDEDVLTEASDACPKDMELDWWGGLNTEGVRAFKFAAA